MLFSLNDASVDFVDDEGFFQFSPEAEFTPPLYVHIIFATDTEREALCFTQLLQCQKHVEPLSIEMTFKRLVVWSIMIRGHVNLPGDLPELNSLDLS